MPPKTATQTIESVDTDNGTKKTRKPRQPRQVTTIDLETKAINAITTALTGLSDKSRERVWAYVKAILNEAQSVQADAAAMEAAIVAQG